MVEEASELSRLSQVEIGISQGFFGLSARSQT